MKRILSFILTVVLCLSLCACGTKTAEETKLNNDDVEKDEINESEENEVKEEKEKKEKTKATTPLELNVKYEIEEYAEITLVSISTTSTVEGTMGGSMYYSNDTDGETYIDVIFDIVNTSTETIDSDEFMVAEAVSASGSTYDDVLYCVETDEMTRVSAYEDITPFSTARFHAAISVPTNEKKLTLKFNVGGTAFSSEYELKKDVKTTIALSVGDVLGDEEYAVVELLDCTFTDAVYPSNTSGYYRYYKVDNSDNTYLALTFNVTNYQGNSKDVDTFISARATFDGKYKYTGFIASEDDDGEGISTYNDIDPLTTAKVFYLIEVPKSVVEKECTVSVMFNKQEYLIEM